MLEGVIRIHSRLFRAIHIIRRRNVIPLEDCRDRHSCKQDVRRNCGAEDDVLFVPNCKLC